MFSNWLWQSFFAMALLAPAWLAIGFLNRNFHMTPQVFLVWYFLGTAIYGGFGSFSLLIPSWSVVVAAVLVGFLIGGPANSALFQAVAAAPNPGLPVAIGNAASVLVFLAAVGLYKIDKIHFDKARGDVWSLIGILLVILGASIIAIRR